MTGRTLVYVACAGSCEIHSFNLDADGALKPADVVTVPGGSGPSPSNLPLAFAPDRRRLYAALRMAPFAVSSFAIDAVSGTLTCRSTAPLPAPMAYISVSRDGGALMGASYKDGKIAVSEITLGDVQAHATQVVPTPPKAHCIIPGRTPGIVYATTVDGNAIMVFRQDAAGHLSPADPHLVGLRPGAGPRHLALHPTLDVLYCVNELGGTLTAFTIHNDGALRELQDEALTPPGFQGNARAADLHVTANGRFAYASVRNTDAIAAFRIDKSGRLTLVGRFDVEKSPRAFGLDPEGHFLICAGQDDNVIAVYAIDPASGALTARNRLTVAGNPSWIETLNLPVTP
jgi:6-phosphogluconolactonase